MNEIEKDRFCLQKAKAFILEDPLRFLRLSLIRAGELWKLHRHGATPFEKRVSDVYMVFLYGFSFVGAVRLRRRRTLLLALLLALFLVTLVYGVVGAQIRYRVAFVPVFALLASVGLFGRGGVDTEAERTAS